MFHYHTYIHTILGDIEATEIASQQSNDSGLDVNEMEQNNLDERDRSVAVIDRRGSTSLTPSNPPLPAYADQSGSINVNSFIV